MTSSQTGSRPTDFRLGLGGRLGLAVRVGGTVSSATDDVIDKAEVARQRPDYPT